MVRTPSSDQNGLKKGTWTTEEDRKLIAYVTRYGCWNWRQLPKFAGLERCGKSCRLRWMNYLRPNIKRGNYSKEEEELIITLHEKLGNKWSIIATHLPGRTDNEIKNHWHTNLKKRSQNKKTFTHEKEKVMKSNDSGSKQDKDLEQNNGPMSPPLSLSEFSSTTTDPTTAVTAENLVTIEDDFDFLDSDIEILNENLWTQPYEGDISFTPIETVLENGDGYGNFQGSYGTETQTTIENFWLEPYMADMAHVPNDLLTPFVTESDEYFSTLCGVDLWNQNPLHDERNSFF